MKLLTLALCGTLLFSECQSDWAKDRVWFTMTEEQRYEAPIEYKARSVGMTIEEFDLFSSVVEAESDRSNNLEGRILIAETILNRVADSRFPDNIIDVCCQPGQFSVVSNGRVWSVGRTNLSDRAVIEAVRRMELGEAPNVLYFNCIGYDIGTAYCYEGGNYFSVA